MAVFEDLGSITVTQRDANGVFGDPGSGLVAQRDAIACLGAKFRFGIAQ